MKTNEEKSKEPLPHKEEVSEEVGIMATPIQSTPVLKGKDLVGLVNDLKKPDKGKSRRQKALKILQSVVRDKK